MAPSALSSSLTPEEIQARIDAVVHFSLSQIKWLSLIPIVPAILSIFGSVCIISDIQRRKRRRQCTTTATTTTNAKRTINKQTRRNTTTKTIGPYERIMFQMSLHDIFYTIVFCSSPFLTDSDEWWPTTFGSPTTCRLIGTLFQFVLSNQLYYAMLSFYFVLTIRFQLSHETFGTYVEPWMHIFAVGWPLITAITGAWVDWYDELEFFPGCWTDNYPKGCVGDCQSPKIAWITAGTMMIATAASLIVNNVIIVWYIQKRYNGKYNKHRQEEQVEDGANTATRRFSGVLGASRQIQQERIKFVSTQACLYVGTYFITYTWFCLLQIAESYSPIHRQKFPAFPFMVLQAFFSPLAGFWNCLIYFRPKYIRLRKRQMKRNSRRSIGVAVVGKNSRSTTTAAADVLQTIYFTLFYSSDEIALSSLSSPGRRRRRRRAGCHEDVSEFADAGDHHGSSAPGGESTMFLTKSGPFFLQRMTELVSSPFRVTRGEQQEQLSSSQEGGACWSSSSPTRNKKEAEQQLDDVGDTGGGGGAVKALPSSLEGEAQDLEPASLSTRTTIMAGESDLEDSSRRTHQDSRTRVNDDSNDWTKNRYDHRDSTPGAYYESSAMSSSGSLSNDDDDDDDHESACSTIYA